MTPAVSGSATWLFLYDVADSIDLARVRRLIAAAVAAPLTPKVTTPPYTQYQHPPVVIDGHTVSMADAEGFAVRFKIFDYGVISVALRRDLPDTWAAFVEQGMQWHESPKLSAAAERFCHTLVDRLLPAITQPRQKFLAEDYLIFTVTAIEGLNTAEALIDAHGSDVAQLLRAEREPLSVQEREEVLRHRISYLANDLVIPTWNGAFIYDSEAGAQGTLGLLEFANSQLLEFRYYDQLLDGELARIYAQLQRKSWAGWFSRRFSRAARNVHSLFIDVNDLTDKTENALKIVGDVYAARVFAVAAARLGLDRWKSNVRDKLQTLENIYRFAVEQTGMARGELLELSIVLILIFELILFFLGIMN